MTLKKYPEIERLGHDDNREIFMYDGDMIFIEEKVDGGNGSFWLENDVLHFGSRARDLTLENDVKMFAIYQSWLRTHLSKLDIDGIKINNEYIYYIEWMQKHTITYTNIPFVIGFDIRLKHAANSEGCGMFLGREAREQEFNSLKIENVPLIWKGKVSELKKLVIRDLIPKSKYYDGFAEGIVIKNYTRKSKNGNHQLYAKLVRDEFKEDNRAVFGNIKDKKSDTIKIIEQFATDARIRKAVMKFVDEGEDLNLKLMSKIPHYIIKDIMTEEILTIIDLYKFIDLKEMKHRIPKICLRVLREMIEEKSE